MKAQVICLGLALGLVACERPAPARIQIAEASYGANCAAEQAGNVTQIVGMECNGDTSCSFAVNHAGSQVADPCPAQPKDLVVAYRCRDKQKTVKITDAARKVAILSCGR